MKMNSQDLPQNKGNLKHPQTHQYVFDFSAHPQVLSEDVCVALFDGGQEVMHVWFNTNFVDETGIVIFNKDEMDFQSDSAVKDYGQAFTMEIELKEIDEDIEDIVREAAILNYNPDFDKF